MRKLSGHKNCTNTRTSLCEGWPERCPDELLLFSEYQAMERTSSESCRVAFYRRLQETAQFRLATQEIFNLLVSKNDSCGMPIVAWEFVNL